MPNMSDIPGEVATLITTLVADPTRRVFRITGTMCRASAYAEYDSDEGLDGTQLTTNCSAFSKLVEVTDNSDDALDVRCWAVEQRRACERVDGTSSGTVICR